VRRYRLAADRGLAGAQVNLERRYENSVGVPQDYVQAHTWCNLAASRLTVKLRDNAVGCRDAVAGLVTSTQIAEAQRLAREWDAAHPREPCDVGGLTVSRLMDSSSNLQDVRFVYRSRWFVLAQTEGEATAAVAPSLPAIRRNTP
jgi:hypothetical protein